jgi:hypothetical protein
MTTGIIQGNARIISTVDVSWTPAAVSANASATQTVTVSGAVVGDIVITTPPGQVAGTLMGASRVSAANIVSVQFGNVTAGSLTPTAGTYKFTIIRPDRTLTRVAT